MFNQSKIFLKNKKKMHKCLILYPDNTYNVRCLDHTKLEQELGKITFVGGIPEFGAFAVGSLDSSEKESNPFCKNEKYFEKNVKGNVVLIGSDASGEAMDLDCEKLVEFITTSIV